MLGHHRINPTPNICMIVLQFTSTEWRRYCDSQIHVSHAQLRIGLIYIPTLHTSIHKLLIYYLSEIFSPSHCQVRDKDQQAEPPSHTNTENERMGLHCGLVK